ncbi:Eco57I restriction-modification methylase domain-containing protein [Corynebacterium variabile]|uniref:Eco57I restriction-modification methylase domain-containing protein n=1 Tax=Corynebacterium variabile TaxID=1727 RepID=UPI003FD234E5
MKAENEKTIETRMDQYLTLAIDNFFGPFGIFYRPNKEQTVDSIRVVTKGRADTSVGRVVIEFKQPRTLKSSKDKESALEQIWGYVDGFNEAGEEKTFAMVTDGSQACICLQDGERRDNGNFSALSVAHLERLIIALVGSGQKSLTSRNLVKDFAETADSPARTLAQSLMHTLEDTHGKTTKGTMLLAEWKHLFRLSHDDESKQPDIIARRKSLERYFRIDICDVASEYMALFSLQTAYAVILKVLSFKAISDIRYDGQLMQFSELITSDSENLRFRMEELESGTSIRQYGIHNLLEGDYFSWYVNEDHWDHQIAESISNISSILNEYQTTTVFSSAHSTQDLFKNLYQQMIPAEVRHSLGEYYTPEWLATRTIERSLSLLPLVRANSRWRGLDPTCGSGTFITAMIKKVAHECEERGLSPSQSVREITSRVVGIDLNPLAALTARVNYFLNVSMFLDNDTNVTIPIYCGDAAYIPQVVEIEGVEFIEYSIDTELRPINIRFPAEGVSNVSNFIDIMAEIEMDIVLKDECSAFSHLVTFLDDSGVSVGKTVQDEISSLVDTLIEFEANNWNGIWSRVIANYVATAMLGQYDVVVGNPPWVDWKSLPSSYRDRVKSLDVASSIFSGDNYVGGINLNIAALICTTSAAKWLSSDGVLGMLMPDTFLKQRTYEGFRKLAISDAETASIVAIDDWSLAGKPFSPVSQKFLGYFISKSSGRTASSIPVIRYKTKERGLKTSIEKLDLEKSFSFDELVASRVSQDGNRTNYVICESGEMETFKKMGSGESQYVGREGMRFFPLELLVFKLVDYDSRRSLVEVENVQNPRSRHRVPKGRWKFERDSLRPLIRSADIRPYFVSWNGTLAPFPFDSNKSTRTAVDIKTMRSRWPKLFEYFVRHRDVFVSQSNFTSRLVAKNAPFYSIARSGDYSFAPRYVVFRATGKSMAAVVESIDTPWGKVLPAFQDHAPFIAQRPDGSFLGEDEADYICGILNCDIVRSYAAVSADSRSMPITPRYALPLFGDPRVVDLQREIARASRNAKQDCSSADIVNLSNSEISELYLRMLDQLV